MSRRRRPCNGAEVVHRPCPAAHSSTAGLHLHDVAHLPTTAAHAPPSPGAGLDIIRQLRCNLCE